MSHPPPHAPPTLDYAAPRPPRVDLRTVAIRQKGVIYCIFAYVAGIIVQMFFPADFFSPHVLFMLGVFIAAMAFVFLLAMEVYGVGRGIVLGLLTLIPPIGLVILLIVNHHATHLLRRHGIRVGLFGADRRQIPDRGQMPML
jgi:hypothetical protein